MCIFRECSFIFTHIIISNYHQVRSLSISSRINHPRQIYENKHLEKTMTHYSLTSITLVLTTRSPMMSIDLNIKTWLWVSKYAFKIINYHQTKFITYLTFSKHSTGFAVLHFILLECWRLSLVYRNITFPWEQMFVKWLAKAKWLAKLKTYNEGSVSYSFEFSMNPLRWLDKSTCFCKWLT